MRLFLVRHAHAVDGTPDDLRPLSDRGREQARELAAQLAAAQPDVVLSSPLLRARETADAIARASGAPLQVDERLAPGASVDSLLDALGDADGTVVAVGHQPDCSEIAIGLTGGPDPGFAPAGYLEVEVSPDRPA